MLRLVDLAEKFGIMYLDIRFMSSLFVISIIKLLKYVKQSFLDWLGLLFVSSASV